MSLNGYAAFSSIGPLIIPMGKIGVLSTRDTFIFLSNRSIFLKNIVHFKVLKFYGS